MKQKFKAIVAAVLVMASLFAMASLVSAGFVEEVFSEVCDVMTYSSSTKQEGCSNHKYEVVSEISIICTKCLSEDIYTTKTCYNCRESTVSVSYHDCPYAQ